MILLFFYIRTKKGIINEYNHKKLTKKDLQNFSKTWQKTFSKMSKAEQEEHIKEGREEKRYIQKLKENLVTK